MLLAVENNDLDVAHRIAGESTLIQACADALLNRRKV
jgi:hypothetical protein